MKKLLIISAVCCSLQLFIGINWGGGACNAQGHWTQKANYGGATIDQAVAFSIGTKGYIGTGFQNTGNTRAFWQWNQTTNVWTQKANFGGTARSAAVGFSIGTKGYIGTGYDNDFRKDFWEWDQLTNTWTQKADFGGTARLYSVGFSIGTNGYIGIGNQTPDFTTVQDFWEWNQSTDTWTQKADFAGGTRVLAVGFSIGNKGYIGTGGNNNSVAKKDFWEWDPATDAWTQKADIGSDVRFNSVGFSIGTKGYIGTGEVAPSFVQSKDFWEWDQASNTWSQQADYAGPPIQFGVGFSIGTKGYIGTGLDTGFTTQNDFWEFSTDSIISTGCSVPTGEYSTQTIRYVTLNWNIVPEAISYKVRYKVDGTIAWTKKTTFTNSAIIRQLLHNTTYVWQVKSFCAFGNSAWSSDQTFLTGPMKLSDEQAMAFEVFPDPFESSTTIAFSLEEDSRVQLELFDIAGRKMQTVLDDNLAAGNHVVTMNRNQLNAGVYFLQMRMNNPDESGQVEVITKKVMIVQ